MYVELGQADVQKPRPKLTGDAKEALKDYYDAVHTLYKAQTNLMQVQRFWNRKLKIKWFSYISSDRCSYQQSKCWSEPWRR